MLCGPSGFYVVANVAVSDLNNYSKRNEIRQFKPTAAYPRMYSIRLPPTHLLLCSQFNISPESELFPRVKPFVLVPVWSRGVGNAMRNVTRVRWDSSSTRAGRQSRHKSRCTRRERQDGGRISYLDRRTSLTAYRPTGREVKRECKIGYCECARIERPLSVGQAAERLTEISTYRAFVCRSICDCPSFLVRLRTPESESRVCLTD